MEKRSEDAGFLEELRKGSAQAFEDLYRNYYKMTEELVVRYHGTPEDARDVFQDTLLTLVKKIRDPEFRLTGKLSTYLYAVMRNIWLKKTGKATLEVDLNHGDLSNIALEDTVQQEISIQEKEALLTLMTEKMEALMEDCRTVLRYAFYQKLSHAEIAVLTGYSEDFVRVKKFRCLEYLRRMLRDTRLFKNL